MIEGVILCRIANIVNKPLAAANKRLRICSIRLRSILSAAIPAGKVSRENARKVKVEIAESISDDADSPFMTQRKAVSWAETALPETRLANQSLRKAEFLSGPKIDVFVWA